MAKTLSVNHDDHALLRRVSALYSIRSSYLSMSRLIHLLTAIIRAAPYISISVSDSCPDDLKRDLNSLQQVLDFVREHYREIFS